MEAGVKRLRGFLLAIFLVVFLVIVKQILKILLYNDKEAVIH
ncbi:hypothetical protein AA0119_g7862 [Alternaria tenuissima]|jgi:hypothetical protein|uniref:Uncharacterized protein n=2 Tax=Alternaria alternata complex TaxID=187734 RepID=A0A4Q4N3A9_ALTAL|nr:hypothetical protein AA0115_g10446 [Alternaria tenuissima]RYN67494.1 hypothetical protein AA0117_g11504 [Alternaria alternata]RYN46002.1 hypothetical protein AA0114_g8622 [Alternaria tenuissima]RYN54902.1 hypothetical protein AA0118_g8942 [Alternaria tenuissima]RYN74710.1 hypothetical protein AA0120_g12326 [Alternaria tenuissima]